MTVVYLTMIVIVLVALAVAGTVMIGMEGAFHDRAPKLSNGFAEAARHMNGDAEPPKALVDLMPSQFGPSAELAATQH